MKSGPSQRRIVWLLAAVVVAVLVIGAALYASSNIGKAPTSGSTTGTISTTTASTGSPTTSSTTSATTAATATTTTSVTFSNVTPSDGPLLYTSGLSTAGLQLRVMLNSSAIPSHGAVGVQIELFNALDQNVSLSIVPNKNITNWDQDDFLCSVNPSYSMVGYALFQGHFAAANISAGSPLRLGEVGFEPPCLFTPSLASTTFLPNSDNTVSSESAHQSKEPPLQVTAEVNATTGYCVYSGNSTNCTGGSGLFGYWNTALGSSGNGTLSSKQFAYLPSGEYTLVAADDWNQYVYAYLTVTG